MQVNLLSNKNSNNFGMALHMNTKKIGHKLGKEIADGAHKAEKELQVLATDCHIYVRPCKSFRSPQCDSLEVFVAKRSPFPLLPKIKHGSVFRFESAMTNMSNEFLLVQCVKKLKSLL